MLLAERPAFSLDELHENTPLTCLLFVWTDGGLKRNAIACAKVIGDWFLKINRGGDICTPTFIAAFPQQPNRGSSPSTHWQMTGEMECGTCRRIVFSLRKRDNSDPYYSMDRRWGHSTEWNRPVTTWQVLHDSTYVFSLEKSNSLSHRQ